MNDLIFIPSDRKASEEGWLGSYWYTGAGWYFLDETSNYLRGGDTEEQAIKTLKAYVDNL